MGKLKSGLNWAAGPQPEARQSETEDAKRYKENALPPASLQKPLLATNGVGKHLHPQLDLLWSPGKFRVWLQGVRQGPSKCSRSEGPQNQAPELLSSRAPEQLKAFQGLDGHRVLVAELAAARDD